MDNSAFLVEKIINDSKMKADAIMLDAMEKVERATKDAGAFAEKLGQDAEVRAKESEKNTLSRSGVVAELDARKLILDKKKALSDSCFALAEKKITAMKDTDYLKFIAALIQKYGENGDSVIISKSDEKRITAAFVEKLSKELKIKLTLSKSYGNFSGGIILSSNGVDKNLTVSMQISELKAELESKVVEILQI